MDDHLGLETFSGQVHSQRELILPSSVPIVTPFLGVESCAISLILFEMSIHVSIMQILLRQLHHWYFMGVASLSYLDDVIYSKYLSPGSCTSPPSAIFSEPWKGWPCSGLSTQPFLFLSSMTAVNPVLVRDFCAQGGECLSTGISIAI